jgi:hypothetical protein
VSLSLEGHAAHDGEQIRLLFEGHDIASEHDGPHGDLFLPTRSAVAKRDRVPVS